MLQNTGGKFLIKKINKTDKKFSKKIATTKTLIVSLYLKNSAYKYLMSICLIAARPEKEMNNC